ncbi:PilC/PilY family type IV pilus protein [Acinetobacter sp. YH12073]|uniref:PilC/PilY family type IV pilus protein n=1 Tax=Acinetobacter sp. YH12073 TaxID=2601069 RepID=UPI001C55346E|nr:PilC/PilY family type IV pilus protein [Acinetobacter sp. YH12073]
MQLKKIQMTVLSASLTALMCSGVTQASDLQIYAMPTAGQKTIVMMVDVSGSMAWGMSGQYSNVTSSNPKRIEALKDGLRAVLNSNDPKLENVVIGLGKYPGDGNSNSADAQYMRGKILVEAKKLGPSTKTKGVFDSQQRRDMLAAVNAISVVGGTPTAHGYTEAASYLMGTRTDNYNIEKDIIVYNQNLARNYRGYYKCDKYLTNIDTVDGYNYYGCDKWIEISGSEFDRISSDFSEVYNGVRYYFIKNGTIKQTVPTNSSSYSGMANSVGKITTDGVQHYNSPLPAIDKRVTCDGQGVYVLSDGVPNSSSDANAEKQMINAMANPLLNTSVPNFSCNVNSGNLSNPLTGGDSGGAWKCMGEFAKRLYSGVNPAGVKIQTAFVGYSGSFNSLSSDDVKNACRLGSNPKGDVCSHYQADGLTKNTAAYANHVEGYGNGGFYTANSANDITTSVLNFIDNLGTDPLAPLPTGTISVPVDALNPNGLQNVGYLRMLEPNPAQPSLLAWVGNLKKYSLKNGVLVDGTTNIFDTKGDFETATKNLWGARTQNDGGKINVGGAYEMMPVPIASSTAKSRKVFTDAARADASKVTALSTLKSNGDYDEPQPLLQVPKLSAGTTSSKSTILDRFKSQDILKDFPIALRLKLLNYIGFKVDTALEAIPSDSEVSYEGSPYFSMGGIIHSFPVQMTYSGTVTESGELATSDIELPDKTILKPRKQSVLYGSMEGGLHIVDGATGEEQMVFLPTEILNNQISSNALVKAGSGTPAPAHGVDSPWIVDSEYRTEGTYPNAQIKATKMNVFGGLRMGGSSYYALDVLDTSAPKLKFRIGTDQLNYTRMGQSWSKPVLINIRYKGVPTRAMVVGGGYDACYEYPRFKLGVANPSEYQLKDPAGNVVDTCNKTEAKGNAVYVVDAETGKRLFWVSNTGSDANNPNLKHSIVSRISTLDRDGDGYVDHLYFGDLGGQVFRVDMDNYQTKSTSSGATTYSNFGVRTVRLANLATTSAGAAITNGDNPRLYEPVTLTIHDEDGKTFILVGAASGDRSTPLDVAPVKGRDGLSPLVALANRPTNKVYGLFDLDFINKDLITNRALTGDYTSATTEEALPSKNRLKTRDLTLADLLQNPQNSISGNETIYSKFFNATTHKQGWYRSLSWSWDTTEAGELANNTFRQSGGLKAFEEPIAIGNNLFIPVYDPEGTGISPQDPCLPRVIGETDRQQYCLPFGVCITTAGAIDSAQEKKSGFRVQLVGGEYKNSNVVGKGIQGLALANKGDSSGSGNSCGNFTLSTNTAGIGTWQCNRVLNPTRWFEKR